MEGKYDIILDGKCVGQACVKREGLYYDFSCQCSLKCDTMYKLVLVCGQKNITLGTPFPAGDGFVLHKKLPVKYFGEGQFGFCAVPKQAQLDGVFVPICQDEPFSYLNQLKNARLQRRDGVLGVVLHE